MGDLTLLIIRHAEKPGGAWPGPGLTDQGAEDDKSLVIRGWHRAGALASLFAGGRGGVDFPSPAYLYAATQGAGGDPDTGPSRRPAQTLTPLAARLPLDLNTGFAQGAEEDLVAELLTLSGVVLVAWEHKAIVSKIIPKLPISSGSPPTNWPGDRFDAVLRFDRPAGIAGFAYRMLFPRLLGGDSDQEF